MQSQTGLSAQLRAPESASELQASQRTQTRLRLKDLQHVVMVADGHMHSGCVVLVVWHAQLKLFVLYTCVVVCSVPA